MGDPVCRAVAGVCAASPTTDAAGHPLRTRARQVHNPDGSWTTVATDCAVPAGPAPVPARLLRDQVRRLVPHPAVGVAPPGGRSLVNIQTVLWLDTAPARDLGTVTLLGHRVGLRVRLVGVAWDFGDGQHAHTTGPGRAYDPTQPCTTARCTDYWGHVYTTTGPITVSADLSWTGQYRLDTGTWTPITGTVTAPATPTRLTLLAAHSVLVTPPGQ